MEFRTDPVFDALKSPLGLVDDDARRQALERYVEAARMPLDRAVFDLLSDLTAAIDERVAPRYRVRLAYRAGALDLEIDESEAPSQQDTAAEVEWTGADGEMEKVTIRIPSGLKEMVSQAASGSGVSVNSWFIRALVSTLRGSMRQDDQSSWGGGGRDARRAEREREREERHREREREREERMRHIHSVHFKGDIAGPKDDLAQFKDDLKDRERSERRGPGSRLSGWIGGE